MKRKKLTRLLAMSLGLTMVLSLTACQSEKEEKTEQSSVVQQSTAGESQKESEDEQELITTDPVTLTVLTQRNPNSTNDATDLWFFKYMEYWFAEQGYDVTIEVSQTAEAGTQLQLMMGTDSLPDIVWAIPLSADNVVSYGADQGALLDWTPYINEENMPNLYEQFQNNQGAYTASVCMDGKIYGIPYISPYMYGSGTYGIADRMFVNQTWLDECGLEVPTTEEEFIDMLRAFKENIKLESGEETIPFLGTNLMRYLWVGLGYYGSNMDNYGLSWAIKDEEIYLPAYTEDYRHFVEVMHTLYQEGLISQDFFTMESTTMNGLLKNGNGGAMAEGNLTNTADFSQWVMPDPILFGDNDEIYVSNLSSYTANCVYASADTKYPEIVAMFVDFVYGEEGAMIYRYGFEKAEDDPLGILPGYYYNDKGVITVDLVEDGTFLSWTRYAHQYIYPYDYAGIRPIVADKGLEKGTYVYQDAVTGEDIVTETNTVYSHDNADGHWRLMNIEKWNPYATAVRLPAAYLSLDDSSRAAELKTLLKQHIEQETAEFITGIRPLSELDTYFEELEALGVEEYVEIYRAAYSSYMDSIFK